MHGYNWHLVKVLGSQLEMCQNEKYLIDLYQFAHMFAPPIGAVHRHGTCLYQNDIVLAFHMSMPSQSAHSHYVLCSSSQFSAGISIRETTYNITFT